MEQSNNKKTLILSLVAVLVLVGSVVGVAYAMFSFSATGTQTNVIKTGYVTINYENEKVINLTNALPTADDKILDSATANTLSFDVSATINGTITVNYDLAIDPDSIVEGTTLKKDNIKIRLLKSTDGQSYTVIDAVKDVTIADLTNKAGTYANGTNGGTTSAGTGITSYALDSGSFTTTGKVYYKLIAWVSDQYVLNDSDEAKNTQTSDPSKNTVTQTKGTEAETFTFAVKVVAGQANYNE